MRRRKPWTCDHEGCDEIVQGYRRLEGKALKLCSKHYVEFARKHWGRSLEWSELNEDDIRYLKWTEYKKEEAKRDPFDVRVFSLDDGTTRIKVRDRQTNETRSFVIKDSDYETFNETYGNLQKKGFFPKPSIDDYVKKLRKEEH